MTLIDFLLSIHITAGFAALLSAFVATLSKSFDAAHKWHVISGKVFFIGMSVVFCTALPISIVRSNIFLLLIAIFSFYMTFSGWRYAKIAAENQERSIGLLQV